MAIELNKNGNCATDYTGSGLGSCDITQFGDAKGIILFEKGWSKSIENDTFDLASYLLDVKSLKAFPYIGIYDFTQDTPENEKNTSALGILTEIRAGKPQYSFMYDKGSCLHKSLYNKRGNGLWDFGIVFESGVLLATNSTKTELKAFDGGMLSVETLKFQQGTDPMMSTAIIQLLDAIEFNAYHQFFRYSDIGDIDDVKGAIETKIVVDAIEGGDTTFTATITSACNSDSVLLGLDDPDLWVLGGVQASATAISDVTYNATTMQYTFTVDVALAEDDTVLVKLNDGTYDVVEDATGNLYKGTSNTVTVSAAPSV